MKNTDIRKNLNGLERTVTIIGKSQVKLVVSRIVAVIDADHNEAEALLSKSISNGHYMPLLGDKSKIRSYILTENGDLYPSTFRVKTICDRMASDKMEKAEE